MAFLRLRLRPPSRLRHFRFHGSPPHHQPRRIDPLACVSFLGCAPTGIDERGPPAASLGLGSVSLRA